MNLLNKLLRHELISGSFYLFIGFMVSNITAFLVNLFYARNLSYADYGIFASLLSLITLAMIPASSLNTIIVKFATDYFSKKDILGLNSLYSLFFKFIIISSAFFMVVLLAFSNPLMAFLKINSFLYILLTGFAIVFFYFSSINTAFLQSELKFIYISFLSGFSGIIKLITGVFLVLLGFGAFSGLWAIILMGLGIFIVALWPLKNIIYVRTKEKKINLDFRKMFLYAVPTFTTILFMTSITSADVILVKHFFNPHDAGFYAGLSLVGKVIFYFTGIVPMVMFPLIVKRISAGQGFINVFILSVLLVLLPSLAITGFYFLFPKFVVNMFLGGRDYITIAPYLGYFGIFLTMFSIANLFVSFYLSLGRIKIVYPVAFAAILQIILISLYHNTFGEVIIVSLGTCLVLLLILIAIFIKLYSSSIKLKETVAFLNTPRV